MAVDANGDGLDDQTGAPMASSTGGMPVMSADQIVAAVGGAYGTPGGGGGATNWMADYRTQARTDWKMIPIYVGTTFKKRANVRNTPHGGGGRGLEEVSSHSTAFDMPAKLTPFQLLQDFDTWTRKRFLEFKNKMVAAGLLSPDAQSGDVRDMYERILQQTQETQMQLPASSRSEYTPLSLLNNLIRLNGIDPNKIPGKEGYDPSAAAAFKPSTQKVTSVYDMDPAQAEVMLTQTLQQALGRDPSKAEIEDFVDAVKSRALQDPTTQVTQMRRGDRSNLADANTQVSVTTQGGKSFSQIQTVNDGFTADDAALLAQKRAEAAPDYASAQAVSTYFPAFLQALGSTV